MRDPQKKPERIFLDTNIYILGASEPHSPEGQVLTWLRFEEQRLDAPMVLVSQALVAQILRGARRWCGKDWAGEQLASSRIVLRFFIGTEKSLSVEMNHMIRLVSYPNFCFPRNFSKISDHFLAAWESSYKDQSFTT